MATIAPGINAVMPGKIVMKGTGKMSLNARFSSFSPVIERPVPQIHMRNNWHAAEARRIAQQMEKKPTVRAALHINDGYLDNGDEMDDIIDDDPEPEFRPMRERLGGGVRQRLGERRPIYNENYYGERRNYWQGRMRSDDWGYRPPSFGFRNNFRRRGGFRRFRKNFNRPQRRLNPDGSLPDRYPEGARGRFNSGRGRSRFRGGQNNNYYNNFQSKKRIDLNPEMKDELDRELDDYMSQTVVANGKTNGLTF